MQRELFNKTFGWFIRLYVSVTAFEAVMPMLPTVNMSLTALL